MTASGTFGYGEEFAEYVDLESIGAFVTKGLSLKPRAGNPTPRIVETPGGMLNAIGLQNVGIDAFIAKKVPYLRSVNTPAIANFFGNTVDEYAEMARRLDEIPEVAGSGSKYILPERQAWRDRLRHRSGQCRLGRHCLPRCDEETADRQALPQRDRCGGPWPGRVKMPVPMRCH